MEPDFRKGGHANEVDVDQYRVTFLTQLWVKTSEELLERFGLQGLKVTPLITYIEAGHLFKTTENAVRGFLL